jgi:hypothetical protein
VDVLEGVAVSENVGKKSMRRASSSVLLEVPRISTSFVKKVVDLMCVLTNLTIDSEDEQRAVLPPSVLVLAAASNTGCLQRVVP